MKGHRRFFGEPENRTRIQAITTVLLVLVLIFLLDAGVAAVVEMFTGSIIGGLAVLVIIVLGTSMAAWRAKVKFGRSAQSQSGCFAMRCGVGMTGSR